MAQQQGGSRKISFNVSEQYDIQDVVGEGAYGVVCSALHKPSGQKVAIKKITPFDHCKPGHSTILSTYVKLILFQRCFACGR